MSNNNKCVQIIEDDRGMRSEKINDLKEDAINIRKIRQKLLPRSASSVADSTTSVSKLNSVGEDKENAIKIQSTPSQMNGTKHISMKLRRKSEIANNYNSTNWMVRPTDQSEEASETDIIILRRWVEQTQLWSVEENPLKTFRLKDGEDMDEMDIENKVLRCVGGKLAVSPPVMISVPLDPCRDMCNDINIYSGDRDDGGLPHGKNVVITFNNGDVFRGDVEHGKRQGYGILQFAVKKKLSK